MYYTLLTIQYVSILGLFVESWLVLRKWKNTLHTYLFFSCVTALINNLGNLLEMKSETEESCIVSLQFSYLGRVWYAFALFLFVSELCKVKIPEIIKNILVFVHAGIYVMVLSLKYSTLYYTEYKFVSSGIFSKLVHENGIGHHVQMGLQIVYIVLGLKWLISSYIKEKNKLAKKRYFMILIAIITESVFFVIQIIGVPGVTDVLDITLMGYFIGTIIMLSAIFSLDLLGMGEMAREFVIDRISEGIIAADNDGMVQYVNVPAKKLYPKLKNKNVPVPAEIIRAAENNENITIDAHIFTPEVNDLLYEGESFGKLYALVDETEHYKYMEELEKQKEIADSANEAKSRFLANMSHEIRTPINAVLGMDEMILRESGEDEIRAYASDIMSAGKTLLSIINDILDLSKVEEGKMEIIPVQYEVSSLINDLVNMVHERAYKKGLELVVNVDEHIPHLLYGDEIRIRQCALNLLTNAVKYTEEGSVTFKVSYEKKDEEGIMLKFTVADTGIGMKEEDMEKLFSPYQRIEEKRNRSIEGTGLGMSITKDLLYLMGSSLDVKSEYGKGSVFAFSIEQKVVKWDELGDYSSRFNDLRKDIKAYRELFHAPDARILVVDDTEMNLVVIKSLLKKTKLMIDTAASGKEAIELAGANRYDVIFIDHMMPDMDGIETLKHIREFESNKAVPVIALTANAVSGARQMYLDAGFTDYLSKPVDGDVLEKMLFNLLPKDKVKEPVESDSTAEGGYRAEETDNADESPDSQTKAYLDKLSDVSEIDKEAGLKNCGSSEGYLSVLSVFHKTAGVKAEEIKQYYDEKDIENYTIKVHALKSSARIIGAGKLSGLAEELENAGKSNDIIFINKNTSKLLEMYNDINKELQFLDEQNEELPEIEPEALREAYQTIYEIAQSMDYGLMDDILKSIRGYKLKQKDNQNITKCEQLLTELAWNGIIEVVGNELNN